MTDEPHARFVILEHCLPASHPRAGVHWDLMFELQDGLLTFACQEPPDTCLDRELKLQRLEDHRLAYLDYEGDISGGRGSVTRWDCGIYLGGWQAPDACWSAHVVGDRLKADVVIHRREDHWHANFLSLA